MSDTNSRLVYSTASGFVPEPTTKAASASPFPDDGIVRLRRENKGRKGAGVITIHGIPTERQKELASLLKKKCGTGGAIKEGIIEIQGEKRELIQAELIKAGFTVKLAGG